MTNEERIESYLRRIAPHSATNAEIARHTEVQPHAQVFQITKRLIQQGRIKGGRQGNEWRFWAEAEIGPQPATTAVSLVPASAEPKAEEVNASRQFEELARRVMSEHYGTPLMPDKVPGVEKIFDFVSFDKTIVGDAKFFSLVRGEMLPPAKFSIIAEHIWLLEKTRAAYTFLTFGNDRRVPLRWLEKFGSLMAGVEFFFIDRDAKLEKLR